VALGLVYEDANEKDRAGRYDEGSNRKAVMQAEVKDQPSEVRGLMRRSQEKHANTVLDPGLNVNMQ
jgi:hypothetical protein